MENTIKPSQDDNRPIDWGNVVFLTLSPLVAVFGTAWYVWAYGFSWWDVSIWLTMHFLTSVAITGGYHRYYSHRAYDCSRPVQLFYMIFGAATLQNSVLNWSSDHRYHHRFVDQDEDPYNINKGAFYAHMGWIFYKDTRDPGRRFENSPDLLKDPLVIWQHKYYLPLAIAVSFVLPALLGLLIGRPLGGLLWGGFVRCVIVHHTIFLINSAAHIIGTQPYDLSGSARDSWLLAPITFGEGYHNFHHKFQADYRNGHRWWHFDITKWWINSLSWTGHAWRLRRTPESLILKAQLEVEKQLVAERLAATSASEKMEQKISARLAAGARRLEEAHHSYLTAKAEYRHRYEEWTADVRRQWQDKLAANRADYETALSRWRLTMRAMNRLPQPSASGLLSMSLVMDVLKHRVF